MKKYICVYIKLKIFKKKDFCMTEQKQYKASVNDRYKSLKSVYLGKNMIRDKLLEPGKITVIARYSEPTEEGIPYIELVCNLNANNGILSGLNKLYSLGWLDDGENPYEIENPTTIRFVKELSRVMNETEYPSELSKESFVKESEGDKSVFEKQQLRHMHIEPFRPENLSNWEPETETDIYMAWGILEEYTGYKYCCGTSSQLLRNLNYKSSNDTKPDAILINEATDCYEIAEMKIRSSDFKKNHSKEDVDVLVVWKDDEMERDSLPKTVIELYQKAKDAALSNMNDD